MDTTLDDKHVGEGTTGWIGDRLILLVDDFRPLVSYFFLILCLRTER